MIGALTYTTSHPEQNHLLVFIRRNLRKCPPSLKSKAYLIMVHPTIEYSSTVWSLHQAGLKKEIERVQRKAAHLVCNQPYRKNQWERECDDHVKVSLMEIP